MAVSTLGYGYAMSAQLQAATSSYVAHGAVSVCAVSAHSWLCNAGTAQQRSIARRLFVFLLLLILGVPVAAPQPCHVHMAQRSAVCLGVQAVSSCIVVS